MRLLILFLNMETKKTFFFGVKLIKMKNRDWLILAMIIVPLIGIVFNIYALFLFIPLGVFFKNKKNY